MSNTQRIERIPSKGFTTWLKSINATLILTTYRRNQVYCIGLDDQDKISIWFMNTTRPMGIFLHENTLWMSSTGSIMRFEDKGPEKDYEHGNFTNNFIPQMTYVAADVDAHDVRSNGNEVFFISTGLSCVCKPSETHTVEIVWYPPWIKKPRPGDLCHLNGLELGEDGQPRYVTSACTMDLEGAWRNNMGTGVVYDIKEEKFLCKDLHSPHSPRWYKGRLWVLEAGTGRFGYVHDGKFIPKVFLPSFIRGLDFLDDYAIVGGSLDRHNIAFKDIPLGYILKCKGIEEKCAIYIIDMKDIDNPVQIHEMEFTEKRLQNVQENGGVLELYDVMFVPNSRRARIKGFNDPSLTDKYYIKNTFKRN